MTSRADLIVKIIPSAEKKVIGWKGNVLEITLPSPTKSVLLSFLSSYLNIPEESVTFLSQVDNLYTVSIASKHTEDLTILFTE